MSGIGATRLYAAAIAIVSGVYSVAAAVSGLSQPMMMAGVGTWGMLVIGLVVLVHGVVLLTPAAMRLGRLSGPLMVVWAVIMLAIQGLGPMGMAGMMAISDAGMVAVALLMLASGTIMIAHPMDVGRGE